MARVALVLGSGGARGYAHLGAVQEIRDRGHEIVAVSGTSMGAVVGGLVAAGKDDEFAAWAATLTGRRVVRLADPTWAGGGAATAERLMAALDEIVGDVTIESLAIPYTAVATDLLARREVWFQRGPLIPAMRASFAIPGLFTPAVVDGRVLVDGGLLNPLPLEPTAAAVADFTIAVSLQGPREPHEPTSPARGFSVRRAEWAADLRRRFRRGESSELDAEAALEAAELSSDAGVPAARPPEAPAEAPVADAVDVRPDVRTSEVVSLSFDAMQSLITRYRLAALPPDVLVTIPLSAARTIDFHRAEELLDLGRTLTKAALDDAGR
ncbi:patatin-like phospholipase family protein [Nocardioides carbamazepini]|uniref:patatin-like phospholipase family protein n=1 Tax=Nocardioides carbamazepini TaxID=2854259 RepID=UPI002149DC55|nr:patatin-like phospholipase family protein [Nocardioides carbamazepini]MCR1783895.1 patatin-like phospholipase family protein [Nocardioides carbamazepini]